MPVEEEVELPYLLGDWVSEDSVQAHTSILVEGNDALLRYDSLAQPYLFTLEQDSASVQGIIINWPPYYCYLEPIDAQRRVTCNGRSRYSKLLEGNS